MIQPSTKFWTNLISVWSFSKQYTNGNEFWAVFASPWPTVRRSDSDILTSKKIKNQQILFKILFFRRKIVLPQKRVGGGGGGHLILCPPPSNRGGGGTPPPPPPPRDFCPCSFDIPNLRCTFKLASVTYVRCLLVYHQILVSDAFLKAILAYLGITNDNGSDPGMCLVISVSF